MLLIICINETQNVPMAPKKSFPRNGNPGRFARTIMRKSGCATMTESEQSQFDAAYAKYTCKHTVSQQRYVSLDRHHFTGIM